MAVHSDRHTHTHTHTHTHSYRNFNTSAVPSSNSRTTRSPSAIQTAHANPVAVRSRRCSAEGTDWIIGARESVTKEGFSTLKRPVWHPNTPKSYSMGKGCVRGGAPGELTLCVKLSADITKCIDHDRRQTCLRFVCAFRRRQEEFCLLQQKGQNETNCTVIWSVWGGGQRQDAEPKFGTESSVTRWRWRGRKSPKRRRNFTYSRCVCPTTLHIFTLPSAPPNFTSPRCRLPHQTSHLHAAVCPTTLHIFTLPSAPQRFTS